MKMKRIDADDPMAKSADVADGNLEQLRALFPEAFSEGHLDLQILRQLVGDLVVDEPTDAGMPDEKYGLNWKGKRRARQLALTPSLGTLRPCRDESVEWDTTQNLMIEGDNLEVLKLLQKSYSGKVKLIYIDPPYNTGKDFVYPDNFHDNIRNYLELTGQVDGEGRRLTSNPESSGRFHTDWLNMMYPRLKLARNLLREDGVIFISIDDGETAGLRIILNEVFGEENFLTNLVWQKKYSPQNDEKYFSDSHEHILVFCRALEDFSIGLLPRTDEANARYKNPDNDPRGPWKSSDLTRQEFRERDYYEIVSPATGKKFLPPKGNSWGRPRDVIESLIEEGRIWFGPDGNSVPSLKRFLSEVKQGITPQTILMREDVGDTQEGKKQIKELFGDVSVFETVKPTRLVERLMLVSNLKPGDIVLDFFAGSGTTGHAVMAFGANSDVHCRYILVQLPEPTGKSDYRSISEITKERLRLTSKKLRAEIDAKWAAADAEVKKKAQGPGLFDADEEALPSDRRMPDLGFRVFKLDTSNVRVWNPDASKLGDELLDNAEHVLPDRDDDDLLYEMLLKLGLDLAAPIAERTIAGKKVVSIGSGALMACLEKDIEAGIVEELALGIAAWHIEQAPAGETAVFFRDSAFADDVAKSNLTAILEQKFQNRKKDLRIRSI